MNEARDLQHPDITRMEATGEPRFPQKIQIEVSQELASMFCENEFEAFFTFLMINYPDAITGFLDDDPENFSEFIVSGDHG